MFIHSIEIYETYHAGAIKEVCVRHADNQGWVTVWLGRPEVIRQSRIFKPDLQVKFPSMMSNHYNGAIMSVMASQITSASIVYSTVYSGADQRTHQSSAWLAFVRGIHRWPVNSPHKRPVTRKMFPFDDIMLCVFLVRCGLMLVICTHNLQGYFACNIPISQIHNAPLHYPTIHHIRREIGTFLFQYVVL